MGRDEGISYGSCQANLTKHVTCLNYIYSTTADKKAQRKLYFAGVSDYLECKGTPLKIS
jgi:hypothetical protein